MMLLVKILGMVFEMMGVKNNYIIIWIRYSWFLNGQILNIVSHVESFIWSDKQ